MRPAKGMQGLRCLALPLAAVLLPGTGASAQGTENTVRVGWYESPFNTTDEFGRRSGYAYEYQQKISATEIDTMTGLYNKNYFDEYGARMYRETPEKQMDAIVLNIEQFHAVNAIHGRAFGDEVIRALGDEIHEYLKERDGIACHSEADRFSMYCSRLEDHHPLFDRLQRRLNGLSPNSSIQLRMGVMPWQRDIEPQQQMEQALIACNLARGYFKEHLVVFDDKAREREALEHRLEGDLRRAVEDREFEVHYQPKYDIQSAPRSSSARRPWCAGGIRSWA